VSSGVEQLAAELVKLSAEEWKKLAELRSAAEIAVRLAEMEQAATQPIAPLTRNEQPIDDSPQMIVRSWDLTSEKGPEPGQ